jgi:tetratricopeptide (TPR) repeat protein
MRLGHLNAPRSNPADPAIVALLQAGRAQEALPLARQSVAGARSALPAHALLASVLLQLGRTEEAADVVTQAATLGAGDADACDGLAFVSLALDRHELANELYRRATALDPRSPRHWYNLACSERSFGRLEAAEQACDRGIEVDPAGYRTYLLRAELKVQTPQANHIDQLRTMLARPGLDAGGHAYVGYALAKELDDVQRCDEAFACFTAAAQARRSLIRYDVAGDEARLRRIAQAFPKHAGRLAGEAGASGASSSRGEHCIFIVGLPRSGTTLVERILGGLPGVRSNGETDNFSRALNAAIAAAQPAAPGAGAARVAAAAPRPDMFARAAAADPAAVSAHYERFARVGPNDLRVVEKLPTNYLYLGAIARALPAARLIWVRRDPLDGCFALFRTLFGDAYPFTYDWQELARYQAAFDVLMGHWRRCLTGSLYEVVYEELVRDPNRVGAELAAHCGLPWSPAALDLRNNRAVSLTASAAQVRGPVYGTSSGRWRRYRRHLAPLIAALRSRGMPLPDDA